MHNMSIAAELSELANRTRSGIDKKLPTAEPDRKVFLLNLVRTIDFLTISSTSRSADKAELGTNLVLYKGWNDLLSKSIDNFSHGGIYNSEFTAEIYRQILQITHLIGRCCTVQELSEEIQYDKFHVEKTNNNWSFSRKTDIDDPLLGDSNEFRKFATLLSIFDETTQPINGWETTDDIDQALKSVGRFRQRTAKFSAAEYYCNDIEDQIAALAFPFDSGLGIMTGYDASTEVDMHFIALAFEFAAQWSADLGLHPDTVVGGLKISHILQVTTFLVSLHLKHIQFCVVASNKFPQISLSQSLSIWTTRSELIDTISELSDKSLPPQLINEVLHLITLKADDSAFVAAHPRIFIPLLIDMGGDKLLRPVSSIAENPFESVKAMIHWRFPDATNILATPREDWLRKDIYNLFRGNRYFCTEGNVKLKVNGKILTDVDGAVFDKTTGELGLFQLKWQDYSLANKKALRSRAKNLSNEMDSWGGAVWKWINERSVLDVMQSFKIPMEYSHPAKIFLFGVSRNVARTQGYGAITQHGGIALSNFGQFNLARMEIGPVKNVLNKMHERLFFEMEKRTKFDAIPTSFFVAGNINIVLPDFFYQISDE